MSGSSSQFTDAGSPVVGPETGCHSVVQKDLSETRSTSIFYCTDCGIYTRKTPQGLAAFECDESKSLSERRKR